MQGRVDKIAKTMALLEQPFIKDSSKTVAGALMALCCAAAPAQLALDRATAGRPAAAAASASFVGKSM